MGFSASAAANTGLTSSTLANVGLTAQIAGTVSNAIGSYYGGISQQNTLMMQANADLFNAQSTALSMQGEAALEWVNSQAQYSASLTAADFSRLNAEYQANQARTEAAIGAIRASGTAASLEAGAIIDENNAKLNELQAQAALLRGTHEEQQSRLKFAQTKSKTTASMAARGIDLGQGAGLSVRAGYDLMSENTAIQIQQAVLMEALGQRSAAMNNTISAAGKRAQAGAVLSASALSVGLADANANFAVATANAEFAASQALARAGLINAQARLDYREAMADIMNQNASVAALIKTQLAGAISPATMAVSSLLSGAGQVGMSWYQYSRQSTGKVN